MGVQAVLRFRKDQGLRPVHHVVGDFLPAMRGQAVQHDGIRFCFFHQGRVHLIPGESFLALHRFFLLAHADPGVGVEHIRVQRRLSGFPDQHDPAAGGLRILAGGFHGRFRKGKAVRRGDREIHTLFRANLHQRDRHVVPVADERQLASAHFRKVLDHGQHIGHRLAGVAIIRQPVDHRHARMARQFQDVLVREYARHDPVHVAREYPAYVGNRFALAEPDLVRGDVKRIPAEMTHPHFEGYPGAQAGFLENHSKGLALQNRTVSARRPFLL